MEKLTWSYLNALFDHHFKDTISQADFLHCIKGLHYILDETVQKKYNMELFGKPLVSSSMHAPEVPNPKSSSSDTDKEKEQPSLLQQHCSRNRTAEKLKSMSYDKNKVKDILAMVSQLSDKLDIPITNAFDRAEEIISLSQPKTRTASRS
ncbi:hypothetical protein AX15_004462 [Amanita polypyramis BW_CC]|nr:hypothetical protein AX15_004462 [Amanita polypyramis BW_CC]